MLKSLRIAFIVSAALIMAACGGSKDDSPTATAPPTLEPTLLPMQSTLIMTVEGAGDIATEFIKLDNHGPLLNLTGWQIVGPAGQTFTFPEHWMFQDASFRIMSRAGSNTPAVLYWGSSDALWRAGSTLILHDGAGQPQTLTIVGE